MCFPGISSRNASHYIDDQQAIPTNTNTLIAQILPRRWLELKTQDPGLCGCRCLTGFQFPPRVSYTFLVSQSDSRQPSSFVHMLFVVTDGIHASVRLCHLGGIVHVQSSCRRTPVAGVTHVVQMGAAHSKAASLARVGKRRYFRVRGVMGLQSQPIAKIKWVVCSKNINISTARQ